MSFPEGEIPDLPLGSSSCCPHSLRFINCIVLPQTFRQVCSKQHTAAPVYTHTQLRKPGEREISSIVVTRRSYRARVEFYSVVTSFQRRCRSFNPLTTNAAHLHPIYGTIIFLLNVQIYAPYMHTLINEDYMENFAFFFFFFPNICSSIIALIPD